MIKISITGIEQLQKKLDNLVNTELPKMLREALDEAAIETLQTMQLNTPNDTGLLLESEKIIEPTPLSRAIGPDKDPAYYAWWVEAGHHTVSGSWVPGQFYVQRTYVEIEPRIKQIFRNKLAQTKI